MVAAKKPSGVVIVIFIMLIRIIVNIIDTSTIIIIIIISFDHNLCERIGFQSAKSLDGDQFLLLDRRATAYEEQASYSRAPALHSSEGGMIGSETFIDFRFLDSSFSSLSSY